MVLEKRKKKLRISMFVIILVIIVIAVFAFRTIRASESNQISEKNDGDKTKPVFSSTELDFDISISTDKLYSSNGILIRLKDNEVLLQKNSDEVIYPASLTKMMTAIVAIENLPNLNEKIKLTTSMFEGLYEAHASMAGFQPDEEIKAIDLLYGAMLPSGAESCIALAVHIAGSEQNFVKLMNQKAQELGMKNTHFENTTGLHHESHYTTVKDLSVLLNYALKNDTFREIFTTFIYPIPNTNKHLEGITLYSTLYIRLCELSDKNIMYGKILGGKTGYTEEAGLCLASLAKVGNQEYILITTGAKGDPRTEQYNVIDALVVYNSIGQQWFRHKNLFKFR